MVFNTLIDTKPLNVMSVPTHQKTTIPTGGYDKQKLDKAISADHVVQVDQYCHNLPPAPRDQLMVNPPFTKKPCKKYNLNGLPENNCYIVVNTAQGLPALYCGTGSNANYVRGNQFSNSYDYYGLHKGAQYQVEQPKIVQNQIKIQATDHYYPYPHWNYTTDPKYYTYPKDDNFLQNGDPIYNWSKPIVPIETFANLNAKLELNGGKIVNITIPVLIIILIAIAYYLLVGSK